MITRKSTYGLRALAGIARNPERLHSLSELASNEGIPKAYLTLILGILRRHGILAGLRGPAGGYELARDAREISLASVVEILDGPLFFDVDCLSPGARGCVDCPPGGCALRRALSAADRAAWGALESIAVQDLARATPESPSCTTRRELPLVETHGSDVRTRRD
jgi:Rrf2 family protein